MWLRGEDKFTPYKPLQQKYGKAINNKSWYNLSNERLECRRCRGDVRREKSKLITSLQTYFKDCAVMFLSTSIQFYLYAISWQGEDPAILEREPQWSETSMVTSWEQHREKTKQDKTLLEKSMQNEWHTVVAYKHMRNEMGSEVLLASWKVLQQSVPIAAELRDGWFWATWFSPNYILYPKG